MAFKQYQILYTSEANPHHLLPSLQISSCNLSLSHARLQHASNFQSKANSLKQIRNILQIRCCESVLEWVSNQSGIVN